MSADQLTVLRLVTHCDPDAAEDPTDPQRRMWHVVLTVAGAPVPPASIRSALALLADERPFLMKARYDADRAEIRYWDEAECLADAAALALRLWGEHRLTSGLPSWEVVALEVLDRETFRERLSAGDWGSRLTELR